MTHVSYLNIYVMCTLQLHKQAAQNHCWILCKESNSLGFHHFHWTWRLGVWGWWGWRSMLLIKWDAMEPAPEWASMFCRRTHAGLAGWIARKRIRGPWSLHGIEVHCMLIVAALVLAFQGSQILGAHDVKFSCSNGKWKTELFFFDGLFLFLIIKYESYWKTDWREKRRRDWLENSKINTNQRSFNCY